MKALFRGLFFAGCFSVALAHAEQEVLWSQQEPDAEINRAAVAVSPDGQLIATGRADSNDVKIWNANTGALVRVLNGQNNNANVIAFSPDGQYLATGTGQPGQGLSLDLWRVSDGVRLVGRIPAFANGTISLDFSPDGQFLVASGFHATGYNLYHVPDMTLIGSFANFDPALGHNVRVQAVAFSKDGQFIGVGDTVALRLRRASDGSLVRTMNTNTPYAMPTNAVAFSPDGLYVAAGVDGVDSQYALCVDCRVKMFTLADGELVRVFENGNNMTFPQIAFSPKGNLIGSSYAHDHDNGGAVQFWDVQTGATVQVDQRSFWFWDFAFSPKGDTYGFFGADGLIGVAKAPPKTPAPWDPLK
jgi:WD40 repeat protein